jgi:hypothetical protein
MDRFMIPAYVTAAIFLGTALMDIVTLGMPFNPSAAVWRFGTIGAASNNMITAFFGIALACWTAMYYGHRTVLRALAVVCFIGAALLVFVIGDFALAVARLRGSVPAEQQSAFGIGTVKATLKYTLTIMGFVALAFACWKGARSARR